MTDWGQKCGTPSGMFQFLQGFKIKLQRSKIKLRTLQLKPMSFNRGRGHGSYMNLCATTVYSAPGVGETPMPQMFGCPPCLDALLYVWMPPECFDASICLDAPHVWMPSCMFGCPLYVWMPPICLDVKYIQEQRARIRLLD